jgi:hypothetical protein
MSMSLAKSIPIRLKQGRGVLALVLPVLVIYACTRSALFNIDGVAYAIQVRDAAGIPFSNGSHILYPTLGYLAHKATGADALAVLQWINILAGVAGIAFMGWIASLLLGRDSLLSYVLALGLAFSYGYWFHATDAEDVMVGTAALLGGIALLAGGTSFPRTLGAAACLTFAALLQTSLLLGALPMLVLLALFGDEKRTPWRTIAIFICGSALFITISLTLIATLGLGITTFEGLGEWMSSGVSAQMSVWGSFHIRDLARAGHGAVKSLIAFPVLYERFSIFMNESENLEKTVWGAFTLLTIALVALQFAVGLLGAWSKRESRQIWRIPILCAAWVVPMAAAAAFWAPADVEFWVAALPGVWLFLGWCAMQKGRIPLHHAPMCTVAVLLSANLLLSFSPAARPANNTGRIRAEMLRDMSDPGDRIITPGADWLTTYGSYFAERHVFAVADEIHNCQGSLQEALQHTDDAVREAFSRDKRVWVGILWQKGADDMPFWEFLRPNGLEPEPLRRFFDKYPHRKRVDVGGAVFMVLQR